VKKSQPGAEALGYNQTSEDETKKETEMNYTPATSVLGCCVIFKQKLPGKRVPVQCADWCATWALAGEKRDYMEEMNKARPGMFRDIRLVSSFGYIPVAADAEVA
jgi:hypothetical protein